MFPTTHFSMFWQELRNLVRRVRSVEEHKVAEEENKGEIDAAVVGAKRSLNRFLRSLAKQICCL